MAAPDPAYIRGYNNDRNRHRKAAYVHLAEVVRAASRLLESWDVISPTLIGSETERVASSALDAAVRAAAYTALNDVEFLATDPDAEG